MGEIIGGVIKSVVTTIYDLIQKGNSAQEAADIVKRNIRSLREQYDLEKAEDEDALNKKHGRD